MRYRSFLSHFFIGAHVALILITAFFVINNLNETRVYQSLVTRLTDEAITDQQKVGRIFHGVSDMVRECNDFFSGYMPRTLFRKWFGSSLPVLTVGGACAGSTQAAGRALQVAGYTVRVVHMRVGDEPTGHVVLETKVDGKWVFLDALFNLVFTRPDGTLASYEEVRYDMDYYADQLPAEYPYAFGEVRYTNWNKIPVLMPMARRLFSWIMGEQFASQLSVRSYFLNTFGFYALVSAVAYVLLLVCHGIFLYKTRLFK